MAPGCWEPGPGALGPGGTLSTAGHCTDPRPGIVNVLRSGAGSGGRALTFSYPRFALRTRVMADRGTRAGQRHDSAEILAWLSKTHAPHDEGLEKAFEAPEVSGLPAIQVGPNDGRLLFLLLRLVQARRVVEIGTLAGYSAIWLARALGPGGRLWTVEADPAHADVAEKSIEEAGCSDVVTVCRGPALEVLPSIEDQGPFDAVFVDADKGNYPHYGAWAAAHVRPGGLLLGDNALFFGRLLDDTEDAAAMRRFHQDASASFDTAFIGTPEGLLLGIRRGG